MPPKFYFTKAQIDSGERMKASNSNSGAYQTSIYISDDQPLHDGWVKLCNANYTPELAANEILMSADYRLRMGDKAAKVVPIYKIENENFILLGTFSYTLDKFSSMLGQSLTTEELVKRDFITAIQASHFRKEGDLHPGNIDVNGRRLDFDKSNYAKPFAFSNNFFINFPDTNDGPWHWPTFTIPHNGNIVKRYDNPQAFINLKKYIKKIIIAFLYEFFITKEMRLDTYREVFHDESLISKYINQMEARKADLHKFMFHDDFIYHSQLKDILKETKPANQNDLAKLNRLRIEIWSKNLSGILKNCKNSLKSKQQETSLINSEIENSSTSSNESPNFFNESNHRPSSPTFNTGEQLKKLLDNIYDYLTERTNNSAEILASLDKLKETNLCKNHYKELKKCLRGIFNDDITSMSETCASKFGNSEFWLLPVKETLKPIEQPNNLISSQLLIFLKNLNQPLLLQIIKSAYEKYCNRWGAYLVGSREDDLSPKIANMPSFIPVFLQHLHDDKNGWTSTSFNTNIFIFLLASLQQTIKEMNKIARMCQYPLLANKENKRILFHFNIADNAKEVFDNMYEIQNTCTR